MSLPDTIFIFGLALVIFGPKKLPEIGRQLGKLVLEFRRASNEFKMQMEEELRSAEQADRQQQLAAQTGAPAVTPAPLPELSSEAPAIRPPSDGITVSADSPSSRVIPVHEEVAELEAVAGDHPELQSVAADRPELEAVAGDHPELAGNGLKHEPEQAVTHHD